MSVPYTPRDTGAWRSGYGQGPFTSDPGGGGLGFHDDSFVPGSLPAQPHPAFAAARTARPIPMALPVPHSPPLELASPVFAQPTRSNRNSRQNSVSGSPVTGWAQAAPQLMSSNAGKPYARPLPVKAKEVANRPSSSIWAQPGVQPIARTTSVPQQRGHAPPAPVVRDLDFDEIERDMHQPVAGPSAAVYQSTPAVKEVAKARSILAASRPADLVRTASTEESPEELAASDPLATQLWKFFAKAKKSAMPHASRMENLAWRLGGVKLAEINASKASTDQEAEDRGRRARSTEEASLADEMDWRAKSRSRSRAVERVFEGMDWRANSRSRSRARVDNLRFPGPGEAAAPIVSYDSWHSAAPYATIVEQPEIQHLPSGEPTLASILGLDAYTATAPPVSGLSSSSGSSRTHRAPASTDRSRSPHRSYDDVGRRKALGSVVGVTGEATLAVNQDATYGFLPRLVRKTSFDGMPRQTASPERVSPQSHQSGTPMELAFAETGSGSWARTVDAPSHTHQQALAASPSYSEHSLQQPPLAHAGMAAPGLSYPYAFHLSNKLQPPVAHLAQTIDTSLVASPLLAGSGVPPSPFRASYSFDSALHQQTSFVNPSAILKSAPPTAAPSPTQLQMAHQVPVSAAHSPSWSSGSGTASTHPSPADEAGGRSRQSTGNAPTSTAAGEPIFCNNCKTSNTPLWRRDEAGRPLCNGCGLFRKLHGVDRPLSLATGIVKKRNRSRVKEVPKKTTGASRAARRSSTSGSGSTT